MKNFYQTGLFFCLAAAIAAAQTGCVTVEEPEAQKIDIPDNPTGCDGYCDCPAEKMSGRAYRLTRMEIIEPEAFVKVLNNMWARDIKNNVLNVLFQVRSATPGDNPATQAFKQIIISAGPGWRNPVKPDVLDPLDKESADVVNSYCLLNGYAVPIDLAPYPGKQCMFQSASESALYFHPGPLSNAFECAPENEPKNNIPVKQLKIRATFNKDCTAIKGGLLEGCITREDAKRICMCTNTGDCEFKPNPQSGYDPNVDYGLYCKDKCGDSWLSFAEAISLFSSIYMNCLTEEGLPGYRVTGFFDAIDISDKFNPVKSDDCMKQ